jgi:hypothetical protein
MPPTQPLWRGAQLPAYNRRDASIEMLSLFVCDVSRWERMLKSWSVSDWRDL